jgi:hypothetical protein
MLSFPKTPKQVVCGVVSYTSKTSRKISEAMTIGNPPNDIPISVDDSGDLLIANLEILPAADLDGLTDVFNQMIETGDHNTVLIFEMLMAKVRTEQTRRLAIAG